MFPTKHHYMCTLRFIYFHIEIDNENDHYRFVIKNSIIKILMLGKSHFAAFSFNCNTNQYNMMSN